jgi:hypothetical protein
MFTYRIYVDGGNHVIGTYEGATLKGEALFLPKALEAVIGTGTTVTIRRVFNQAPVLTNIPFADLDNSTGAAWGANQSATVTALNIFFNTPIYTAGAGTITSVNGDTGPAVVLHGGQINKNNSAGNGTIANAFITVESNITALDTAVAELFTIVGKRSGKTELKDTNGAAQLEITSDSTKVNNVLLLNPQNTAPVNPPTGGMYMNNTGDLFISK